MAVFWLASSRRSAIRERIRVMGTRCSTRSAPRSPSAWRSARPVSASSGALFWAAFLSPPDFFAGFESTADCTSAFVMRPSLPLPLISAAFRSFSAISFLAAGLATASASPSSASASPPASLSGALSLSLSSSLLSSFSGFSSAAASASASSVSSPPASPVAPSSMTASTSPACTVSPASTLISTSLPAATAGTSSTTLSVSRSSRFSSRSTASPCFFCHSPTVASLTDSGSSGTLTSVAMLLVPDSCRDVFE